MKNSYFFAGAVLVPILLIGIWIYLLIFSTPSETTNIFADFGFSTDEDLPREQVPLATEETSSVIDLSSPLTQLTVRPVVGFRFIEGTASSSPRVRYAERGVGYIYDLDLETGTETRIYAKTFTRITNAFFSPSGKTVVLQSKEGAEQISFLEVLEGDNEGKPYSLPNTAENIALLSDTDVRYTQKIERGTQGFKFDLTNTTVLFTAAFSSASVIWSPSSTWLYNAPSPLLRGGLYTIQGESLNRMGSTQFGLSAIVNPMNGSYIATYNDRETGMLRSTYTNGQGATSSIAMALIPEKCSFAHTNESTGLVCGAPPANLANTFQKDWYTGSKASSDVLWEVDLSDGSATLLTDFVREAGRMVDIAQIDIDPSGRYILFRNKIDNTLWIYDKELKEALMTNPENIE